MFEDKIEGKNTYELAKIFHELDESQNTLKKILVQSVQAIISYSSEKNKLNCLGEEPYLDYIIYQKKFKEKDLEEFLESVYEIIPFSNDLTYDQKYKEFKEGLDEIDESNQNTIMNWIIAKKLQKRYFSVDSFENYLKAFD